jgi:iron complex outermembrane receptor protein
MNKLKIFAASFLLLLGLLTGIAEAQQTYDTAAVLFDAVRVEAYQVNGPLRNIPGSLSVLNSSDIKVSDGTNLTDALNTIPGLSAQTGTYTTNRIVIRGMGSRTPYNTNRIRTYINDIPFTGSDGLSSPEEVDVLSFGRIELVKGPSSALFGSGLGGSLNLYTPVDTGNEINFVSQYGNYNTWKANLLGTVHPRNLTIWSNISHFQSDGYRENNRYQRSSLFNTARWQKSKLTVEGMLLFNRIRGEIPSSLGETQFRTNPESAAQNWKEVKGYKRYVRGIGGVSFNYRVSSAITNKLILFGKGISNYEKRPFNNLKDHSAGGGIRDKFTFHSNKTELVIGTEIYFEAYVWQIDTARVRLNRNREQRSHANIFSVLYYHPGPKLNISLAGAVNMVHYRLTDLFAANGDQSGKRNFPIIASPRIGISYAPSQQCVFYCSAGHGYSLPSPEETLLPEGDVNHNIKPEQGFQTEIGTRLNFFNNALYFEGTAYWIELRNLLVTKRLTEDIFTGINAGQTRHQGIEAMLFSNLYRNQLFPGNLSVLLTYSHSWNRFIDFTDEGVSFNGNRLPGIPDNLAYVRLKWAPMNFIELTGEMRYTGKQYLNDSNSLNYGSYIVGNLGLSANISFKKAGSLNIYCGLNNISDTRYASMLIVNARSFDTSEPRYYYPGLPRNGYFGIHYNLAI